jgi:hypothetical protein
MIMDIEMIMDGLVVVLGIFCGWGLVAAIGLLVWKGKGKLNLYLKRLGLIVGFPGIIAALGASLFLRGPMPEARLSVKENLDCFWEVLKEEWEGK